MTEKYMMIQGTGERFVELVNELLDDGWILHGNTHLLSNIFYQAFARVDKVDSSNISPTFTFNDYTDRQAAFRNPD